MKLTLKLLLIGFLQTVFSNPGLSQEIADSAYISELYSNTYCRYTNSLQNDAPIFNGRIYRPYPFRLENEGHAFFESPKLSSGWLFYEGKLFENKQIMYDLVRDELVLLYHDNASRIILPKDKIDAFSVFNHTFVHVRPDSSVKGSVSPGYYDLLFKGKVLFVAKRTKNITETATQSGLQRRVETGVKYFLYQDSTYFPVRNKKGLLKLLRQTRVKNQQFLKTSNLSFRTDKETAMVSLIRYYDAIKP